MRGVNIIVFGATGFTGKFIVKELKDEKEVRGAKRLSYAVCGRSEQKLKSCFPDERVVVADAADEESMVNAFTGADVVINATGPYRFYGEQVMRACLLANSHYVDVSGEPAFLERAVVKFSEEYEKKKLIAIGSCGFDSIPADLGAYFTSTIFPSTQLISLIRAYHILHNASKANFTTFESAVHSMRNSGELASIRKELPTSKVKLEYPGGKRKMTKAGDKLESGLYSIPFPGADASVVRRSQATLFLRDKITPVQFQCYFTVGSWFNVMLFTLFGILLMILTSFSFGVNLLLRFPEFFSGGVFSREGPSDELLDKSTFEMRFVAEGWNSASESSGKPTRKIVTTFAGADDPFYRFTATAAVASARCILEERSKIPFGVHTPTVALRKTSILDRLRKRGIKIQVVSDTQI
mmetsp:Transcript_45375/g.176322  ORF Transcript_45375/g.176322 Transcript_45375/m.176322 type:complete len:410 (+) Transcript_45375:198-1427(+)|eukprot:CAMPEP_0113955530 /NCGR_PEP_ID=MMETSP0011_2-20120614/1402_1 /TAXON_ID=101924 /ORGANISM="Rhodosorus marinus" /LENGTH=409 /DNA_ID=CAMNT_0000965265 /DNA_START=168 /DNA_END=1397 /DNA_ORIENTATION=+ /assembly_acc=CAM_ASM_000156